MHVTFKVKFDFFKYKKKCFLQFLGLLGKRRVIYIIRDYIYKIRKKYENV